MVLEPKFIDYGSIHPTPDGHSHPGHHSVGGPRSALLPPLDDEDAAANSSAGPKMTQGLFAPFLSVCFCPNPSLILLNLFPIHSLQGVQYITLNIVLKEAGSEQS